jgi:hypothetical protein
LPPKPGTKVVIGCPTVCSLSPHRIGETAAEQLRLVRQAGYGAVVFERRTKEILGWAPSRNAISRHLRHYREELDETQKGPAERVADLEFLQGVIDQAYKNRGSWRPTLRDALEAMKLKHTMTGGSEMADLLAIFEKAAESRIRLTGAGARERAPEADEAVYSAEERVTGEDDEADDG